MIFVDTTSLLQQQQQQQNQCQVKKQQLGMEEMLVYLKSASIFHPEAHWVKFPKVPS